MAKQQVKQVEVPAKKVVKTSGQKVRNSRDIPQYKSESNIKPFNDMWRDGDFVAGLTEEEKIAGGMRPAFQQVPDFKKTPEERARWKKVHTNRKGASGWFGSDAGSKNPVKGTLIVHLPNRKKDKDFKTTHSFKDVAEKEIWSVISTVVKLRSDEDSILNHVSKFHFRGKTFIVDGKKINQI